MLTLMNRVSAVVRRVLLEVDRRRDPDREREERHEDRDHERAEQALDDPGLRRVGRQRRRQEVDAATLEDRHGRDEDIDEEHREDRQREEEAQEQEDLEHRARRRPAASDCSESATEPCRRGRSDRRHAPLLVPLPRPADEGLADDVEEQGDHEQQGADEEQALEGVVAACTWSLPVASAAMAAVMVWPGATGSMLRTPPPVAPAARATTIVSPIARLAARMSAATMPGDGRREDDPDARRQAARAQAVRRLAERPGHRPHRVLGDRGDERDRQDADGDARRQDRERLRLGKDALDEPRVDDRQGEEPEDDARDAGQDLEDRLDDVADPGRGVLGRGRSRWRGRSGSRAPSRCAVTINVPSSRVEMSNMPRRGNQPIATRQRQVDLRQELDGLERDRVDDEAR